MKVTARHIRMISRQGFIELFWEGLKDWQTHEECYEALEREYKSAFGKRRYANFISFRRRRDEK
jgi:hypothetical protein